MNVIRPHGQRMVLVTLTRPDGSRWKIALEYCNVEHLQEGRMGTRQHLGEAVVLLGWILSRSRKLRGEHLLTFRDPDVGWGDQTLGRQPPGLLLGLVELDI